MSPEVTALLLNWKRPKNLARAIDSIRSQTERVEIMVWDNSPEGMRPPGADFYVHSSQNLRCGPRWLLARYAAGPYVFTLDDDLEFARPGVVRDCVEYLEHGQAAALGWEGVILQPGEGYAKSHHIRPISVADAAVEILKGRFIFTRKAEAIRATTRMAATVESAQLEDDIMFSSAVSGTKIVPAILNGAFRELPAGRESLCRQPGHAERREAATQAYFPAWT